MLTLKNITMRNFLSVGNATQTVDLTDTGLMLILGENVDLGSAGSRNGVGKTTLIQAISYAIYGAPLTNIKKDNLVNKTNQKSMVVSLELEVDNKSYRIERGRKPNFVRYYVNDGLVNAPDTDEAQGESKWTQNEIERVFGMSHSLFKHVLALHTKTTPFLSEKDKPQRDIIEELMGITQLSKKAESLKEQSKQVKDAIRDEEIRIRTIIEGNAKIQKHIDDLQFKSRVWEREHQKKLEQYLKAIASMEEVDIEMEIMAHQTYKSWSLLNDQCNRLGVDIQRHQRNLNSVDKQIGDLANQISSIEEHNCPMCGHEIHEAEHKKMLDDITVKYTALLDERKIIEHEMMESASALEIKLAEFIALGDEPKMIYDTIEQALDHRHTLVRLVSDKDREQGIENPYFDQIANLSDSGLQEISNDYKEELIRLKDHQDFLLKLLTSKESFIRKKIIDQNLHNLNSKLNGYLTKLQLPHEVTFQSDLTVQIMLLGKEYDFEQLSNGEANRLILSLAWAFRDVWEGMNHVVNLMVIDELVDSGMDTSGTDASLAILRNMVRTGRKNVLLISHKDGLESRVDKVLMVQKEGNFTTFAEPETEFQ